MISFDIDVDGRLVNPTTPITSHGQAACHISTLNGDVYAVNYLTGNVVRFPDRIVTHEGRGPHPTRQTTPHPHYVAPTPDGKYLLCTDLGLDSIFTYTPNLEPVSVAKVPEGEGVRHLIASEDGARIYAINELGSTVSVFTYKDGRLALLDTYDCLPDFEGSNAAAAIRISGEYLYASQRGADCITRFRMEGDRLVFMENTPCGGGSPRDFLIVDSWIFCTNETTDDVTVLALENGKPTLTDKRLSMPHPLCVVVIDL
jgi:6-phosphogluconolactonase